VAVVGVAIIQVKSLAKISKKALILVILPNHIHCSSKH
jgi:hypothetical protein